MQVEEWPTVTMAIFIERPTPFLREFFEKVLKMNYPKNKVSVLLHNNVSPALFICLVENSLFLLKTNRDTLKTISGEISYGRGR